MIRLGVNIDHVATIRQARKERYPDPVRAALLAMQGGADNITCHLREDRRHIQDRDVRILKEVLTIPLNFEMAVTPEMLKLALDIKPSAVTLVPEKRAELTTEGGLNLENNRTALKKAIVTLKNAGIMVALFVEANQKTIDLAKALGADALEFHTGSICIELDKTQDSAKKAELIKKWNIITTHAHELGLHLHLGHGINYMNAPWFQHITYAEEANIGHAIIGEAIFVGLSAAVTTMRNLLNSPQFRPEI